jgi:hypothetical protein
MRGGYASKFEERKNFLLIADLRPCIRARLYSLRKNPFFEGYGLQAVRKCFAMNPALEAEGAHFIPSRLFPQALS